MLITGDLGFGVLTKFSEAFPNQFINAGVAEQNMTGVATGLALEGRTVFTYSIGNFPTLRCLEQIRNDAAYHDANVKIVSVGAGFSYGALGMSHHATEDLAIMRAIPQITVFSPGCMWEVKQVTSALVNSRGTGFLRLDKSSAGDTSSLNDTFEVGLPRLIGVGSDITVVTTGGILGEVLEASRKLMVCRISCEVFSCHTLKPFDPTPILSSIRKTGHLVVIEEHIVSGGLAGLVSEHCIEKGVFPRKFQRIGIRGGFCSAVGSQNYLRKQYGLDSTSIVTSIRTMIEGEQE
jgi:transketolase